MRHLAEHDMARLVKAMGWYAKPPPGRGNTGQEILRRLKRPDPVGYLEVPPKHLTADPETKSMSD